MDVMHQSDLVARTYSSQIVFIQFFEPFKHLR
jgi:hypothetical protein